MSKALRDMIRSTLEDIPRAIGLTSPAKYLCWVGNRFLKASVMDIYIYLIRRIYPMLSETYFLLQKEGILTRSSLLSGLNALRKANIEDIEKGLFYTAFFQLSIGFERLMKLILVIDHMSKNDLSPMTNHELKHQYGHKIESLYRSCEKIFRSTSIHSDDFYQENSYEWQIIKFLNEFSLSTRYYNLDKLSNHKTASDPLCEWWSILLITIKNDIRSKKLEEIESKSLEYCEQLGGNSFTASRNIDGNFMTTLDAIMYPQLVSAAAPYMVWHVFKIFKPFYSLISHVVTRAHLVEQEKGINYHTIPYMEEFFPFLLLGRADVIRRKKWE